MLGARPRVGARVRACLVAELSHEQRVHELVDEACQDRLQCAFADVLVEASVELGVGVGIAGVLGCSHLLPSRDGNTAGQPGFSGPDLWFLAGAPAWNIGANTLGQFKPYLWIEVMGGSPRGASVLILLGLPLGLLLSAAFVVVVDTPSRHRWIMAGALTSLSGWVVITVWPTREAFVYLAGSFAAGASMSGEVAYKVWSQRLIPTMSRATVQGATLAVARVAAALAAAVTPLVVNADPRALFGTVLLLSVVATALCARLVQMERRHTADAEASSPRE